jgi:hypothetical protein
MLVKATEMRVSTVAEKMEKLKREIEAIKGRTQNM